MRMPRDFDAVDLFFAVNSILVSEPLKKAGLNRRGYRNAKKAQEWFWAKFVKAVQARKRRAIARARQQR